MRCEADALREQHRLCPEHVPAVYHFDAKNALIVMQYLPPPHVILRKSITQVHCRYVLSHSRLTTVKLELKPDAELDLKHYTPNAFQAKGCWLREARAAK